MDLRLFGRENIFFEKPDDTKKKNNSSNQTQEQYGDAPVRKKLIQQNVLWDDH